MKLPVGIIVAGAAAFALLQFVRPSIPAKPATTELQAPEDIKHILEKDCYSCHSDQRRLSWFDQIVPAYWLVRHDILTARQHLDFSTLGSKPPAVQKAALYEAVNMVQLGAMPLPDFVVLHPDAKMTPAELSTLKNYLAPWSSALPTAAGSLQTGASPAPISLAPVKPELNAFPIDPAFETWKLISTTDRGDNNTFRFILGNDIAIEAARSGNVSPWPDGARFAKIAWQQQQGADGLVHPGDFVQVELMQKNAQRYRSTDGWGWGRWRGLDLQPYGKDAGFVSECTGCHLPVRGDDYVYTLPISRAQISRDEVVNSNAAKLPGTPPYQPLGWNTITMYVDRKSRTTAILFGNDSAMSAVHARGANSGKGTESPVYPGGAVLALLTWSQRDDPHWFGARIPDQPLSVEFVEVVQSAHMSRYLRFNGSGIREDHSAGDYSMQRLEFILSLPPARLP